MEQSYNQVVWGPDAFGSVCFLVSGYLTHVEVTGGPTERPPRTVEAGVVSVNLFGCVAFGIAAVASYVLPTTGDVVNATDVNTATSGGALAFFLGAALLLPEGTRPTPAESETWGPGEHHRGRESG